MIRAGARPPGGVDHDQQLHQIVVRRLAGRLNQKRIGAPHVLFELDENLAVREMGKVDFAQTDAEIVRNLLRQLRVGAPGVHTNVLCLFHYGLPLFGVFRKTTHTEESGLTRGLSMPDTAPSFECNPRGAAFAGKTPGNRLQSKSGLRFQKYWFNCNNCLKYHASWLFAN